MYFSALINGHQTKIIDLHIDSNQSFVTYIEEETTTTKTIRKELIDSSTILATNCTIDSNSVFEYNVNGTLNGNIITVLKFFIDDLHAYFIYIDSQQRLRGIRKQIQDYDTTLLLNSVFSSAGAGGTAYKQISFVVYESDELVVSAAGTASFVIAETFVNSRIKEVYGALETSSTSGDIAINIRKENKLLGTNNYLLDSNLVIPAGNYSNNSLNINEEYGLLQGGDLLYVDVISTTFDSANGLYVGVVIL